MFVENNNKIKIEIFYKKKGRLYSCYDSKSFEEEDMPEAERSSYKKVAIYMKELTWGLYNEIQEESFSEDHSGNRVFNYRLYKEKRLSRLIESWDAVRADPQGNPIPIPVNEENIKSLSPEIAELITAVYDDLSYFKEDEEKK